MKILLLQLVTNSIKEYSKYSIPINSLYCATWNIDHKVVYTYDEVYNEDFLLNKIPVHPSWYKLILAHDVLFYGDYGTCDYILVLDADAIFQNHEINIRQQIKLIEEDNKYIYVCDDKANGGLINCGSLLLKWDSKTLNFLDLWINSCEDDYFEFPWEQKTLREMIEDNELDTSIVKILPMNTFNSHWQMIPKTNLVAHYMARDNKNKVEIFKNLFKTYFQNEQCVFKT